MNEQSGIKAGDGGFTINVGGNTDLKGSTITGSSDASKNTLTTHSLTTSDISNSMSASASSSGVSVMVKVLGRQSIDQNRSEYRFALPDQVSWPGCSWLGC